MTAIELKPEDEARKLWEACVSYTGANHQGGCEMNFVKFWDTAAKSQAAEIETIKEMAEDLPRVLKENAKLRAELAEARSLREELAEQWKDLQREYIKADNGRLQALMDLQSSRDQVEKQARVIQVYRNTVTKALRHCDSGDKCPICEILKRGRDYEVDALSQ